MMDIINNAVTVLSLGGAISEELREAATAVLIVAFKDAVRNA